ncbi:MAG: hypothetical protein AB7F78_07255 [Hyphomicrobiaceae bacterium]
MRLTVLALVAVSTLAVWPTAAGACSIRGQYCGYPSWAANAFEGPYGFKGNPAILTDNDSAQPAYHGRARKHTKRVR